MIKKILTSLLGMVIVLTWWTIRGDGRHHELVQSIPAKVWDGGGGMISVAVDTTTAGKMLITFDDEERDLATEERVGPGSHSWSVEVPRKIGGYVEFEADAPQIGDQISWTIAKDDRRVLADAIKMEQPLKKNETFGLSEYFDDYSRLRGRDEESGDGDVDDD